MKIVITGSAGFIGGELVKKMNQSGYEDIIMIDQPNLLRTKDNVFSDFIDYNELVSPEDFSFLDKADFCFHLGANSSTRASFEEVYHQNIKFSRNLIDECVRRNIPVVFASSGAIYGSNRQKSAEPNPLTFYGQSKLITEKHIALSNYKNVVCLRYHNVYGPSEHHKGNMSSIISKWMMSYFGGTNDHVLFEGSDTILRDFVHVDDINKINMMFLHYYKQKNKLPDQLIYDVGTGEAVSFQQVANEIIKHTKGRINYIPNPYNETNYQFYTKADITAILEINKETYYSEFKSIDMESGVGAVFNSIKEIQNSPT
jgi:ADP-L-glycero-D-manno-heptose 6-epimerase